MEKDLKNNTLLDILIIDNKNNYKQINCGDEGAIYKYDDKTVFKTFDFSKKEIIEEKFKKIELLGKLKDKACEFPKKLVIYEDGTKVGYTMNYINSDLTIKDLMYLKDKKKVIESLLKLDEAVRRNHEKGILHGDIRPSNFLLDKDLNPKMVDTDIYAISGYGFGLNLYAMNIYKRIFKKEATPLDNDKFAFSLMMMQSFVIGSILEFGTSKKYFESVVDLFDLKKETKEILNCIFSDAKDKPYFGDALKSFDEEVMHHKKEDVFRLMKIR